MHFKDQLVRSKAMCSFKCSLHLDVAIRPYVVKNAIFHINQNKEIVK